MKAKIEIAMVTPAFAEPNCELELAGILRDLAEKVEAGERACPLTDGNGNTVGHFKVIGQPRRFPR